MDLRTYIYALGDLRDRESFAARCGTTFGHLRNVAYGQKTCRESLAINIERESGGVVRCETLRPDVDWRFLRGTGKCGDCDADDTPTLAKQVAP